MHTVLWRNLFWPGHDAARVRWRDGQWQIEGTAVFLYEGKPCRLGYSVLCDANWHTLSAEVAGWVGEQEIEVEIMVDAQRHWSLNGEPCPAVAGCIDVDLNFSPVTNLLPIRRCDLKNSETTVTVRAAWLEFPSFELKPLEQTYHRNGERTYRYESAGGSFKAELEVDGFGLVQRYGDLWKAEGT